MNKSWNFIDLTGKQFGRLRVISPAFRDKHYQWHWNCECDCGNLKIIPGNGLRSGKTLSCGCLQKEKASQHIRTNYIKLTAGERFGRLTVIEKAFKPNQRWRGLWLCKCDCGAVVTPSGHALMTGKILSCGCYARDINRARLTKYPLGKHPLYNTINNMKQRCYNPNNKGYKNYGGRGITICDEWRNDTKIFIQWSEANGYRKDLSIDRIDNNGPYSPENCRWISQKEQCSNRRSNHTLTYKGVTKTIGQWSDDLNLSRMAIHDRINRGWSDERIITTPLQTNSKEKALLTYNGRTETPLVWSRITGIDRGTIRYRKSIGWTDEEALTIPLHYRKSIEQWREEHK